MQKKKFFWSLSTNRVCFIISKNANSQEMAELTQKTFLTNILKNIIWLLFAGESYQVGKITVT